jgi:hypothetical protein
MGTVKRRVQPEDITLNVGSAGVVPPCPIPGHAWKRVVHDPTVTWLAFWKENVMGATKYVFLSAASSFKGKSDLAKYEKVREEAFRCLPAYLPGLQCLPAAPDACQLALVVSTSLTEQRTNGGLAVDNSNLSVLWHAFSSSAAHSRSLALSSPLRRRAA